MQHFIDSTPVVEPGNYNAYERGEQISAVGTTSATFGHHYLAKVDYADGGFSVHGPFETSDAANDWINARHEQDRDSVKGEVWQLNKVKES